MITSSYICAIRAAHRGAEALVLVKDTLGSLLRPISARVGAEKILKSSF